MRRAIEWALFETVLGWALLRLLERRAGLALVAVEQLADQISASVVLLQTGPHAPKGFVPDNLGFSIKAREQKAKKQAPGRR